MREQLEQILTNCLLEERGGHGAHVIDSTKLMVSLLLPNNELLVPVPRIVRGWTFADRSLEPSPNDQEAESGPEASIEFHESPAILIHDGLRASSTGGKRLMYWAKGYRLYLFSNGDLVPASIYGQIDVDGLNLSKDYDTDFNINVHTIDDPSWINLLFDLISGKNVRLPLIGQEILKLLCNIKKPFNHEFLLEYLIVPPDVDVPAEFSVNAREILWDICLSREFESKVGRDGQGRCMNILSRASISPAPQQIVSFMKRLSSGNIALDEILSRLNQLENNIGDKIDKIGADIENPQFWEKIFENLDAPKNRVVFDSASATPQDLESLVLAIVDEFKNLIENNGLWKELWEKDSPRHESTAQNLFFLMACGYCKANNIDFTPEGNLGNGPVDFKLSQGHRTKVLVEVKLSSNTKLIHGYETQLEIYKTADEAKIGIFLVIDIGELGGKLVAIKAKHDSLVSSGKTASHIRCVDGHRKLSASVRK